MLLHDESPAAVESRESALLLQTYRKTALAKPLGGGLPLGAVLVTSRVANHVKPGMHGTTFGGNPVACRLGLAVVQTIAMEKMLEKISALGDWLEQSLEALTGNHGVVAVRGAGLMWASSSIAPSQLSLPPSSIRDSSSERQVRR